MKDFKNENEYGSMKLDDETYDGILLKTGDEGYRYYSEDDYLEDSSIADIIITGSYVSETSSTAKVNMNATCANAYNMYIRLLNDDGTVLHSAGTSATYISAQKTFVSAGTYIIESEVVSSSGGRKVRRAPLRVETSVGEQNRCDMCDETGWMSATTQCTSCGAWQTHAAPIQLSYQNESESTSTVTVNMTASCTNAVDMYLRVIREDGTECYSRHASSTNVSKTMPLGAGQYTLQAEAISLTGGIRIATNEMVINPGNSSSSGSSSSGCYNCGGTGYVGSYNCSICNPSTGSSGSSSNNCSNCGGTGYVESGNCSICNPSTGSSGSSSNNCSNCGGTGYVGSGNCSICNPSTGSSGSSSNNCSNCGGTGYVGSANCSICNPEIKSYDCSYCLDTGWLNGQKCTHCSTDDLGPNGIDITPSYSIDSTLYTLNVTATCDNAWWMRAEVENTTFSNEASRNNVSLEAIGLEEGSYSVKVTAQRNGIYRYQYADVTLKNRELSYACPPYIDFSNETGEYNSTTGKYSVSVSVYCEDATHIDMEILNSNKALCASISDSGTSASGICDLVAGRHYARFVIERGSLGTIEDVYAFDVNATTTGAGGAGGGGGGTVTTPEIEDVPDNERKFLLLYTGPNLVGGNYPEFTCVGDNNDIQKLKECGATDFVLLTAAALNYDVYGNRIIEPVTNFEDYTAYAGDVAFEKYDEAYPNVLAKIGIKQNTYTDAKDLHKHLWGLGGENGDEVIDAITNPSLITNGNQVFTQLNMYINKYKNSTANYSVYAEHVASLASNLVENIPNCRLWIGLPPILEGARHLAEDYKEPYRKLIELIKGNSEMATCPYWDNVVGIYHGTEDIPPGYVEFEKDNVEDDFNCPVVKTMRWLKETCLPAIDANKDVQGLWIPYYRDFADNSGIVTGIPERIGSVVNNTDIFDFIILQPSYYFNSEHEAIVRLVKQCVIEGKCVKSNYSWGSDVWVKQEGYSQVCEVNAGINRAIVGAEMEVDAYVDTDTGYSARYDLYVRNFKEFITGTGESGKKAPVAFYVADRDTLMNTSVYQKMKDFFTGNIVVTESDN